MITLQQFSNFPVKGSSYHDAIKTLVNDDMLSDLNSETIKAISFLVQQQAKKELKALKLDNPFKLASLFHGKKDVRNYLNYIYATGDHLISSNGHIMIKIENKSNVGFYNDIGQKNDMEVRYSSLDILKSVNFDNPVNLNDGVEGVAGSVKYKEYEFNDKYIAFNSDYIAILKRIGINQCYLYRANHIICLYFKGSGFEGVLCSLIV